MVDEVGVDPVARDLSGMTTIHAASMGHQVEAVKVRHHSCLTHIQCSTVITLLSLSLPPTHPQWLVTKLGSKMIVDKTKDGATPLHIAAGEKQHKANTMTSLR